jgi:hypothetical protein
MPLTCVKEHAWRPAVAVGVDGLSEVFLVYQPFVFGEMVCLCVGVLTRQCSWWYTSIKMRLA